MAAPFMDEADQVEAMFFATLSRPPDDQERQLFAEALATAADAAERQRVASDMLWALVNSTEFSFNH
jgi:hypothetical protein